MKKRRGPVARETVSIAACPLVAARRCTLAHPRIFALPEEDVRVDLVGNAAVRILLSQASQLILHRPNLIRQADIGMPREAIQCWRPVQTLFVCSTNIVTVYRRAWMFQ